ncbi:MAG: sphingomyelin phosphodiesterase [Mariniphaga sp.]
MEINIIIRPILFLVLLVITHNQLKGSEPISELTVSEVNKHKLKILTWNIYMLPFCSKIHKNCKRAVAIAKEIPGYDYDIIVFEEAFDYQARKILRDQLKGYYPFMYGPANKSSFSLRTNSGIWILSKIPLQKLEQIKFKNRYGIDALARKGAVLFEGEWQGQPFQILGTHLQNDSPDSVRYGQCHEIADKLLRKYAKMDIPQIICGDFNIEFVEKVVYGKMLKILDAENGSLNGDLQTSFDEVNNKLAFRKNGKKQLIDYVLVRNNKSIKDIDRNVSALKNNVRDIVSDLSDHYGIEAIIQFNNPPAEALTLLH